MGYIYLNRRMEKSKNAVLSVADPGFLYGQGLFETMRAYNGRVFALERHIERLFLSLPVVGMKLRFSAGKIKAAVYATLKANRLKEAYVRLTVWQGEEQVNLAVIARKYLPLPEKIYRQGFRAMISGFRQNEHSDLSRVKSTNYLLQLLCRREAEEKGFDEVILLNSRGRAAEGSRTNIFAIKRGKLLTPDLKQGCLSGITRQIVLKLAKKHKIEIWEGKIAPQTLWHCDEAFLTNSLLEIMPLASVNNRKIGDGKREITGFLSQEYQRLVERECKK
jgi:branched-chain amino acid aminotransferase